MQRSPITEIGGRRAVVARELTTPDERAMIDALQAALRGEVIDREHGSYDEARAVWNGLIDRRPAAIARCADADDVTAAVRVAREHRPLVSVRGGGHQLAGSAVCDDGLVIDLSVMREVTVDPAASTARVGGGARWADVDRATQAIGLVTPSRSRALPGSRSAAGSGRRCAPTA